MFQRDRSYSLDIVRTGILSSIFVCGIFSGSMLLAETGTEDCLDNNRKQEQFSYYLEKNLWEKSISTLQETASHLSSIDRLKAILRQMIDFSQTALQKVKNESLTLCDKNNSRAEALLLLATAVILKTLAMIPGSKSKPLPVYTLLQFNEKKVKQWVSENLAELANSSSTSDESPEKCFKQHMEIFYSMIYKNALDSMDRTGSSLLVAVLETLLTKDTEVVKTLDSSPVTQSVDSGESNYSGPLVAAGKSESTPSPQKKKTYICKYCQKKLSSNFSLLDHERTHTNEKPHKCENCKRAFTSKNNLRAHNKKRLKTPNGLLLCPGDPNRTKFWNMYKGKRIKTSNFSTTRYQLIAPAPAPELQAAANGAAAGVAGPSGISSGAAPPNQLMRPRSGPVMNNSPASTIMLPVIFLIIPPK